jgi:hypothetical protein
MQLQEGFGICFFFIFIFLRYIKRFYLQGGRNLIKQAESHVIIQLLRLLSFFSSAAARAEPAVGAAEPGSAETAKVPPAGTLASLPTL